MWCGTGDYTCPRNKLRRKPSENQLVIVWVRQAKRPQLLELNFHLGFPWLKNWKVRIYFSPCYTHIYLVVKVMIGWCGNRACMALLKWGHISVKKKKRKVRTYYKVLRGSNGSLFPWKSIWTSKVPRRIVFYVWTAAWGRILTIDNLMRHNITLVNWFCMFKYCAESVDHHCTYATKSWSFIFSSIFFCVCWVMPSNMVDVWPGWKGILGKRGRGRVWDVTIHFLLWIIWRERNNQTFNELEGVVFVVKGT